MSLIEINISNRIWIGAKYLEHPLVYYSVIMALTCVGKAGESYQTDIDKRGKDMWNFFQADRFFFEPSTRLFYRKWQCSLLLEKMIVSGQRRAFNNETSCLSLLSIDFFPEKISLYQLRNFLPPHVISFTQLKPLWSDRFLSSDCHVKEVTHLISAAGFCFSFFFS